MSTTPISNHPVAPPVVNGIGHDLSPFVVPRADDEQVKNALIMIIDDDEATTLLIRKFLKMAGFRNFQLIIESDKAVEAIKQLQPDVVLLDLIMPVSGLKILRSIRSLDTTCNIPVLTLTSSRDDMSRSMLLNFGANDFLKKPVCANELVARVRNTVSSKLAFDQLSIRSAKLQADILQDSLTGVANRRAFDFELNRKMIEWERQRTPIALILIDIDHFKAVNDQFGHQVGDAALQQVAQSICQATRKMDLVCRVGGEEFAVILPVTRAFESSLAAERIRRQIQEIRIEPETANIQLTVSIGVANAKKGDDASILFRRADTALYAGKQRGRNCSTLHDGTRCVAVTEEKKRESKTAQPAKDPLESNVSACSVLIVDDEPSTVAVVKKYLSQGGFERISTATDSKLAYKRIQTEDPDIVLLDIRMPEIGGLDILAMMRANQSTKQIPVLILTSSTDTATKVQALDLGANDFLQKPINSSELRSRVRNTLLAKAHMDLLSGYSAKLEHEVQLRTSELVAARSEAIHCLARAAEMRDDKTGQHVLRVGRYAAILAAEFGYSEEQALELEHAAQLHDVGKIGVPDAILNKPDRLTDDEFETMKEHCRAGSQIIRDGSEFVEYSSKEQISGFLDGCTSPVMKLAALVAETHHEKWDGSGYPRGLVGEEIPLEGRITAVCDVFDAISTSRSYKKAFPLSQCFEIIRDGSGSHFDPEVVAAFFRRQDEILAMRTEYTEEPDDGESLSWN